MVETITFNGIRYRRYPNSERKQLRNYFFAGIADQKKGFSSLHRDTWKFHHGEIPEGYQIHHADENTLNNDITNLECLTPGEHRRKHPRSKESAEKQREHLDNVRHLSAGWHSSDEGKSWHVANGIKTMENRKPIPKVCVQCGEYYLTKQNRSVTCSKACAITYQNFKAKSRHSLVCAFCLTEFTASNTKAKYCSRLCKISKQRE